MSNTMKKVWIYESARVPSTRVVEAEGGEGKAYVFSGLAADFKRNENGRLYSKEDYLKHLDYLQEKINEGALWGEIDHPERYNVLTRQASHIIQALKFDESSDTVQIQIELFDNENGNHIKGMVDKGAAVYISSRASGYIDDDGNVILEKIYTYDIVNEPGFKNAKLKRKSLNESLGINDDSILIYEMADTTINTTEKKDNMSTQGKDKVTTEQQPAIPLTEASFNDYTANMAKLFEGLKADIASLKQGNTAEPGAINEQVEAITKNFNTAMSLFEEQEKEFGKLYAYTASLGRGFNAIMQFIKEFKEFREKTVNHLNLVSGLVNENLAEVGADITLLKEYHNIAATSSNETFEQVEKLQESLDNTAGEIKSIKEHHNMTATAVNEMMDMNDRLIPHLNMVIEHVNEGMENQEKLTTHINTVSTTMNENLVDKAQFSIPTTTEKDGVYTGDLLADGEKCGEVTFKKTGVEISITESFKSVGEAIKKSAVLQGILENVYFEKYGIGLNTISDIKNNNLKGVPRQVDEAIDSAAKKRALAQANGVEHIYPFLKVISEGKRAEFAQLPEVKQKRVAETVIEKVLLRQAEIENAISHIGSLNDEMLILESNLTGSQVERWNSLSPEKKDIVFDMFAIRAINSKDEFDAFFESVAFIPAENTVPLNEQKDGHVKQVVTSEDEEDVYINKILGL